MSAPPRPSRGLILTHALLSGGAGLVPVPILDDTLAAAVRRQLVRRVAEARQVDISARAARELASASGARWLETAGMSALALGRFRRLARRLAASLFLVTRASEALRTYQIGTLLDHYCAQHHAGLGLDEGAAVSLRAAMDDAIRDARWASLGRIFRGAIGVLAASPRRLAGLLTARSATQPPSAPLEPEAVAEAEGSAALTRATQAGPIRRVAGAIEGESARWEARYLGELLAAFDAAWRRREQDPER